MMTYNADAHSAACRAWSGSGTLRELARGAGQRGRKVNVAPNRKRQGQRRSIARS